MGEASEINDPDTVSEISALFERYEQALVDQDFDVLSDTFWDSPHTIRYALHQNGYGFDEISRHRQTPRPVNTSFKERRIRLEILTIDRNLAVVSLEFKVHGRELTGRQTQTWYRFPNLGWKIVNAHVSTANEAPLW